MIIICFLLHIQPGFIIFSENILPLHFLTNLLISSSGNQYMHIQLYYIPDIGLQIITQVIISIIIGKHMKMFCFKFQQNRTINREFDFLRGGMDSLFINSNLDYYLQIYENVRFHISAKSTINEEYRGEGGTSIYKI